ncbi:MAG: hypothetical protein IKH75_00895 [Ruminococcus sp.]|nr:hypothetical protein [Ruminococcus sp.]
MLCEGSRNAVHGKFVIAKAKEEYNPQIIYIEMTNDKVDECLRIDATANNMEQILLFLDGWIEKMSFNEFPETRTAESLDEIFKIADAILCD